jgi:uncharacterized protein RhaS with RHS repeats
VSGLDFTVHRAYDPTHARWLNRDPIGESGGLNLYAYVNGNPISKSDPTGRFGIVGVGVAVAFDRDTQIFIQHRSLQCVDVGDGGQAYGKEQVRLRVALRAIVPRASG